MPKQSMINLKGWSNKKGNLMARIYTELEFGDAAWVIRKVQISNQTVDNYGRLVTITEDGETFMEDDPDLVAIIPALDE